MSLLTIAAILETALATISPSIAYAYENVPYTPVEGVPYGAVYVLPAEPDNIEIGPGYTERGIFQINLFYPTKTGRAAALAQAALIRAKFPVASTFASGGVTVIIKKTPEIAPARIEDDRFLVPVRIRFEAHLGS